jgi:hypothetical protein
MKGILFACVLSIFLVLCACQAVFTYSPLSFLQRDIDSLPVEQRIERAQSALGSGDPSQMLEAYNAIVALLQSNDDPELSLLAADLAFGASGMVQIYTSLLQNPDYVTEATPEDLADFLDDIDVGLVEEGAGHIQDAASGDAEISDTQYIIAGVALIAGAAGIAGSFDAIDNPAPADPWYQDVQDAEAFLAQAGASDLLDMFGL